MTLQAACPSFSRKTRPADTPAILICLPSPTRFFYKEEQADGMNKTTLSAILLSVVATCSVASTGVAHAQYLGNVGSDGEAWKTPLRRP